MKIIDENVFDLIKERVPEIADMIKKNQIFPMEIITRYISKEKRYDVLKKQKWRCNQCGCKLKYSVNSDWEGEVAHIDHIHPFTERETYSNSAGNINEIENLQALCPKCNLGKSKKEIQ